MKIFSSTTIKISVFLSLFLFFGQTIFAQEPMPLDAQRTYQKYIDNYQSDDPEKMKIALEAAKEYVKRCEKFDGCEPASPETEYFKDAIAALENKIKLESAVSDQKNQNGQISLNYILAKFKSASSEADSKAKTIKGLKSEITERKVCFDLNPADEKTLISVGANDSTIETIRENRAKPAKEEVELYNLFLENYQSKEIEKIEKALEAAKEFIGRFEKDGCRNELAKYLREAVPILKRYSYCGRAWCGIKDQPQMGDSENFGRQI